ncbi:MAG: hypothetical protein GY754_08930 [bacterium]|nr:hypothetical protein [bacterium]
MWECPRCHSAVEDESPICTNCQYVNAEKFEPPKKVRRKERYCPKCNSKRIFPSVRIIDSGEGFSRDLEIEIDEKPGNMLFKGSRRFLVSGSLCSDCGNLELSVEDTSPLKEIYAKITE